MKPINRINPDWGWERISPNTESGSTRWRPPFEAPALHLTLADRYQEVLDKVVSADDFRERWVKDFGEFYGTGFPEYLEEARRVWWVVQVLNVFSENNIDPEQIQVLEADSIRLTVPNPMYGMNPPEDEQRQVAPDVTYSVRGEYAWFADRQAWDDLRSNEAATWKTSWGVLIQVVMESIDKYLEYNTHSTYESPGNIKRDKFGRRMSGKVKTATHRFQRVIEPGNLIGYIWLRIADHFDDGINLKYYHCDGFDRCGMWMVKPRKNRSQRAWHSEACRRFHSRKNGGN